MTVTIPATTKPSLWDRLRRRDPGRQRALWLNESGVLERTDLLAENESSASLRRLTRTNADMVAVQDAIFAAIRIRSRAVTRPTLHLFRGDEELPAHPALDALEHINGSLTRMQGIGYIETHKLTYGSAYWIKRRLGGARGPVKEFEIWQPDRVKVVPTSEASWVPERFELHRRDGKIETVQAEDVVWFRHLIDPRNLLNGLGPIEAIRVNADTNLEAQRFNLRWFDSDAMPGALVAVPEAGEGELRRLERETEKRFRGTDNKHKIMFVNTESMKPVDLAKVSHRDMQWAEQQRWTVETVGRVFEVSPTKLGSLSNATDNNSQNYDAEFWDMIRDQMNATVEELNAYWITPDFGPEFKLAARFENIPALQADAERTARIDEIRLRSAVTVINEIRDRDGLEKVAWGGVPIVPNNLVSLGAEILPDADGNIDEEPIAEAATGRRARRPRTEKTAEAALRSGWRDRLRREMQSLFLYLSKLDELTSDAVDGFPWSSWELKYRKGVEREILDAYLVGIENVPRSEAVDTLGLAIRYAEARSGDLLSLSGRASTVETTRKRVRALVVENLESGGSLRTLKNSLRADPLSFGTRRAETIARTETATALGMGKVEGFQKFGHEGKRWVTVGDDRVDAGGGGSQPCIDNSAAGPVALGSPFPSGHDTVPAHPNCRCSILPVRKMPSD